jgi:hypothetical protein
MIRRLLTAAPLSFDQNREAFASDADQSANDCFTRAG